jgi:hypothetical protein
VNVVAVPDIADVVGGGLSLAEPSSVKVRFCTTGLAGSSWPRTILSNSAASVAMIRNLPLVSRRDVPAGHFYRWKCVVHGGCMKITGAPLGNAVLYAHTCSPAAERRCITFSTKLTKVRALVVAERPAGNIAQRSS